MDPLTPSIEMVINFLLSLYQDGNHYSAIGTARSALSSFYSVYSNGKLDIGNNLLIKKFMKGVYNKRPVFPKYVSTWNPDIILSYLSSLDKQLTLLQLSQKTCMLLLLLTGQRGQTIHLLQIQDIKFLENTVEISFPHLLKHSKPGKRQDPAVLEVFPENSVLCIVSVIQEYLARTKPLRGNESKLFIRTQSPFKAVTRATVSRWVKTLMTKAGIDTGKFKPHSTRAASTSTARDKGPPVQSIMKVAGWTQESTFRRFYHKPIKNASDFQMSLLQK